MLAGDESDDEIERRVIGRQGPPLKSFVELGPLQKRRVSQKVFDNLKKVAEERHMAQTELTGYCLKR